MSVERQIRHYYRSIGKEFEKRGRTQTAGILEMLGAAGDAYSMKRRWLQPSKHRKQLKGWLAEAAGWKNVRTIVEKLGSYEDYGIALLRGKKKGRRSTILTSPDITYSRPYLKRATLLAG